MPVKTLTRSFAGGEISDELYSRVDLDKFQTAVALLLNCWVKPQGPAQNRPGFRYVQQAKYRDRTSRLLRFEYSTQQTFALEFGHLYVRFHSQGATLLEPAINLVYVSSAAVGVFNTGSAHNYSVGQWVQLRNIPSMPELEGRWGIVATLPSASSFTLTDLQGVPISTLGVGIYTGGTVARVYELATPYDELQLGSLNIVQSADVLTIVSPAYRPAELRRLSATSWSLEQIAFSSSLAPPQSNSAVPTATNHYYAVIAMLPGTAPKGDNGYTTPVDVSTNNDLTIPGYRNVVSWNAVAGATTYYVYKLVGGFWGLLGSARSDNLFIDDGSLPLQNEPFPREPQVAPALTAAVTAVAPFSSGVSVTPSGGGTIVYRYVVTSYDSSRKEESIASGEASATNDLSQAGNTNTVRWPGVPGVSEYNVYRYSNGLWAFVGSAGADCVFVDNNILPESAITPPIQTDPFQGEGNYPRAVSYHEQRRVFGGTIKLPQTLWMTRSGTEKNLGYSVPTRDDDGITVRVVAREANTIRHIVPMNDMMLLTSGGEWKVAASDSGALTPSNISVKPQGYTGASDVPPVVTNRTILFCQDRGGHIRELEFSWQSQGYQTSDVSILAPHLFDYKSIRQIAFSRSPVPTLWTVRSDGRLLGMTYVPEHEVRAWSQYQTDGVFESACCVAEGDEDTVYTLVRRTIGGVEYRFIERLSTRRFDTAADQFFVDSGLTYRGAPTTIVRGLYHLEGKTVAILADGGVSPQQVVVDGTVTIEAPASVIHVGLPYVARIKTLPLSMQMQAFGQGTTKNLNKVHLRVLRSNGFAAGPSFEKLRPYRARFNEPYGSAPDLVSDEVEITVDPSWNRNGQICIEQAQPLSLTVLGMTLEVTIGG